MGRRFFIAVSAIVWICISFCLNVYSTDYYVATTGLDTDPGTFSQPFKTIQYAASIMTAGDTCYIREGVYRETVTPAYSGTSNAHITFMPYNSENVVISGCDIVTGWNTYSGYIKRAAIASAATQVFVEGKRINEARYPNQPIGKPMLSNDYWADVTAYSDRTVTIDGASRDTNYWVGGRVVILCGVKWGALCGVVDSSSGNTVHVTDASFDNNWATGNGSILIGSGKGYILGVLGELDTAGEWYAGGGYLYVWAPNNADVDSVTVEARTRHTGMDLTGRSYIDIAGINFKAATIIMHDAENCLIDECSVRYPQDFFSWNLPGDAPWNDKPGGGVEVSGSDNSITNTYIARSWGNGVSIWGDNNTLENCLIEDTNWTATYAAPVRITENGHTIYANTMRMSAGYIFLHSNMADSEIAYNNIHDGGILTEDMGLMYTYMDFADLSEFAYNWIHDNHAPGCSAIYMDGNSSNYLIHHNVIWRCQKAFRINAAPVSSDLYYFNNTIWDVDTGMSVGYVYIDSHLEDVKAWNNLSCCNDLQGTDLRNNIFSFRNCFMDSSAANFSLLAGSAAINTGTVISGITDGYYGTAPDAGAYEYGLTPWTAGADFETPAFEDAVPPVPANTFGQWASGSSIQFSWDDLSGLADSFAVEYRMDSTTVYSSAGTVSAPTETATVSSLDPDCAYYFRVKAVNDNGESIFSRPVLVKKLNDRIGYWRFNDGSESSTTYDESPYGKDGTLTNMSVANCWESGMLGQSLHFDGSDDYVDCGNAGIFNFHLTNAFTISCWIKPDTLSVTQEVIGKGDGSLSTPYRAVFSDQGVLRMTIANGSTSDYIDIAAANFAVGEWRHIAFTYDGSTLRGYVNGDEKSYKAISMTLAENTSSLKIGNGFDGCIDEVSLYTYGASAAAVDGLFDSRSLIGNWEFNDGSGSTAEDSSGNDNDGTLTNMDTASCWITGISSKALSFDGDNDYVSCGNDSIFNFSDTNSFTVSCWIRPEDLSSHQGIIGKWSGGWATTPYQVYIANPGVVRIGIGNGSTSTSMDIPPGNLSIGEWRHLAFTYDGSVIRGYVNGVEKASKSVDMTLAPTIASLFIGKWVNYYFEGAIDKVRMYNYALSVDELAVLCNDNAPVGAWDFNDESGDTVADSSGNDNDGTLTNMDTQNCWLPGIKGTALSFDGTDDYVDCGNDSSYNFSETNNFTIACWIRPDDLSSYQGIIGKWGGGWYTTPYQIEVVTNGCIRIGIGDGSSTDNVQIPAENFAVGEWRHIAFTYDGSVLRGYANGVEKVSKTVNMTLTTNTGSLQIGRFAANYFDGDIDQVQLYDQAFKANKVAALYEKGLYIGNWKFNDGPYSGTAVDSSEHCNAGALTNMNTVGCWVNGINGTALAFDGTDDYVDCGNDSIYNFSETNNFTIACWIRPDDLSSYQGIIGKWGGGWATTPYQILVLTNGYIRIGIGDGTNTDSVQIPAENFAVGEWRHLVFTYDGSVLCGYVNGEQKVSKAISMTLTSNTNSLRIGQYALNYFNGDIDAVCLCSLALNAEDVKDLYEKEILTAKWKFDDGIYSEEAKDSSGNENDADLKNMDTASCWVAGLDGNALNFDGTDDYVECGSSGMYNFNNTNSFTIACWIKPNDLSSYQGIIGKWGSGGWATTPYQIYILSNGFVRIGIGNGTVNDTIQIPAGNFAVGEWRHIAFTYDGSTLRGYVNGVEKVSKSTPMILTSNVSPLFIGKFVNYYFDGVMDDVRLYNIALSSDGILELYEEFAP